MNGFTAIDVESYGIGWSVTGGYDFNGDGVADLVLGGSAVQNNDKGVAHVVFGRKQDRLPELDLAAATAEQKYSFEATDADFDGFAMAMVI